MQVSLYLSEEVVKKVDRIARRERRSRSKVIEALIARSLTASAGGNPYEALVGKWKDHRPAKEIIEEIYRDRRRNRRSERVAL